MASNETKLCQGKDVFERMNFLYQASRLVSKSNKDAASYYGSLMVGCAKKAVLRMEPEIKRTICKRCQSPLIAGETARVRLVSRPEKAVKWTCLKCRTMRRIPTKKCSHKLWIDEPESVVEVFDYTPRTKDTATESVPKTSDFIPQTQNVTQEVNVKDLADETTEKQKDSMTSVAVEDKS